MALPYLSRKMSFEESHPWKSIAMNGILVEWMWWRERLRDLETDKTSSRPPKEHQIFSELSPPILTSLFPFRHRGDEYTCDVCGRDGEYRYGVYHCVKCFAQGRPQLATAIGTPGDLGDSLSVSVLGCSYPRKFRSWTKKHVECSLYNKSIQVVNNLMAVHCLQFCQVQRVVFFTVTAPKEDVSLMPVHLVVVEARRLERSSRPRVANMLTERRSQQKNDR